MLWLLSIPVIMYFTFSEMIKSEQPDSFLSWCAILAISCFFSGLISLVPIGIAAFVGGQPDTHGTLEAEYPLVALREKDGVRGRFYFLGAGAINDQQYYFWYRKNPNGSVSGGKTVRQPGVEVYERDGEPVMITFKTEYKNKWAKYIWLIGIDLRDTQWCERFYIPKGSIREGYSL